MRHLHAAATFFVFALSAMASFAPMPGPAKGALLMLAFWLIGANVGCFMAEESPERKDRR